MKLPSAHPTLPPSVDDANARRSADDLGALASVASSVRRVDWRATARLARMTAQRFARTALPPLALVGALLALWQWYAGQPAVDPQLLPAPVAVWHALVAQRAILWHHATVTLYETLAGFAAALAAGVALAVGIDFSPWLRRALYPLLVTSQTIPILTIAPLLVLWFGFGLTSKVIVVVLVCFFPIVVALADGLRSTDPDLMRLYRTFGAGPLRIFWSVRLPGALPALFSGIRIAVTYSVIGAIFGEYVGASEGLGYYIQLKQHAFATASVIATVAVTALLSVALFLLTALIERVALPWYYLRGQRSAGQYVRRLAASFL